jgi:hypothetical protein
MSRRLSTADLVGIDLSVKHAAFVIEYIKDFDAQRAAIAAGYEPTSTSGLLNNEKIQEALERVLAGRLEQAMIDNEWLLMELVDNHLIARQSGKIAASNTALGLIGKHAKVDAFAAEKVIVAGDKEVMERLLRARERVRKQADDDEPSFL